MYFTNLAKKDFYLLALTTKGMDINLNIYKRDLNIYTKV